jgi:hypothetical protein
VVAAQIEFAAPDKKHAPFGDGVLTGRGTFQNNPGPTSRNGVPKICSFI